MANPSADEIADSAHASAYETLHVTVANHVATVVLNRPEAANAFTAAMQREFRNL